MTASLRSSHAPRFDHAEAIAMVQAGETMTKVGAKFGVTCERIRQIVQRAGIVPPTGLVAARATQSAVLDLVREGFDDPTIAEMLDLREEYIANLRASHRLREANWNVHARNLLAKEISEGRSIRSISKQFGICEATAQSLAKQAGVASACGRWRDLSHRREIIERGMSRGSSFRAIADEVTAFEGKTTHPNAVYAWARRHTPDLFFREAAE